MKQKDEASPRNLGSGRKRSFGKRQIKAIEELIDEEHGLTFQQVKLRLPKQWASIIQPKIRTPFDGGEKAEETEMGKDQQEESHQLLEGNSLC